MDLISNYLNPNVLTLLFGVAGIFMAFSRWLAHKFKFVEDLAREFEKSTTVLLDRHEAQDQARHEENLHRFERISVALARLGSTNGTHNPKS